MTEDFGDRKLWRQKSLVTETLVIEDVMIEASEAAVMAEGA